MTGNNNDVTIMKRNVWKSINKKNHILLTIIDMGHLNLNYCMLLRMMIAQHAKIHTDARINVIELRTREDDQHLLLGNKVTGVL